MHMTLDEFTRSLGAATPPALPPLLRALWHDAKGDWEEAHRLAQDVDTKDGAWVHGYLHRKEGDVGNARYWYRRAGRTDESGDLTGEWRRIVSALLERGL